MRLRLFSGSPVVYWIAVGGLALVTAMVVSGLLGRARTEAARYGSARPVLVATRDVAVGMRVGAGDVQRRRMPAAFVPPEAADDAREVVGRTVVVPLFRGQAVLGRHVSAAGVSGVAALLPPGTKGIAVAAGSGAARLQKGDTVDVLATFDPAAAGAAPAGGGAGEKPQEPTFPVATAAPVVDVAGESVTIAVDAEEAKRVAFATAHGAITVVLTSPSAPQKR